MNALGDAPLCQDSRERGANGKTAIEKEISGEADAQAAGCQTIGQTVPGAQTDGEASVGEEIRG